MDGGTLRSMVEMVVSPGWRIFSTYRSWWMNGEKRTKTCKEKTIAYSVGSYYLIIICSSFANRIIEGH